MTKVSSKNAEENRIPTNSVRDIEFVYMPAEPDRDNQEVLRQVLELAEREFGI